MNKNERHPKRPVRKAWAFRAINLLGASAVTLVIIWQTGMMSKNWWAWFTEPKPTPVAKAPERPPTKPIGTAPPIPKGNDSSISQSPLQLVLVRTQPGTTLNQGSADIGVFRDSPQTYLAGAVLENGAQLAEIHNNYVLLKKSGRSVRLYLESLQAPTKIGDATMLTVSAAKETPPTAKITSREILTDYIRPSPVYEADTLIGFQVYPGAKSVPFGQMGLQAGDVITELNGVPLTDPAAAWDLLRELTDGSSLLAIVKRHGATEQVALDGVFIARAEDPAQHPTQAMLPSGDR